MYISKLQIRNYRNFLNSTFEFKDGVNTLIGENGSGKTNLMTAMRIILDNSLPRFLNFYEEDFNRSIKDYRGQWIIIKIEFSDLGDDDAIDLIKHEIGEGSTDKGSILFLLRPKIKIRSALHELKNIGEAEERKEAFEGIINEITLDDYEQVTFGRASIDISNEAAYNSNIGDFSEYIFPDPQNEDSSIMGRALGSNFNFSSEISTVFIKALRDAEADLKNYKNNPLLQLLKHAAKEGITGGSDIEKQVTDINTSISSSKEISELSNSINSQMAETVGLTYAPNIGISSNLPNDINHLLKSLSLSVGDNSDYLGDIRSLSLGGANLIYISLKILEYQLIKKEEKAGNFLLLEEPEAHIHTHIQKTLFNNIDSSNTQVFLSTHSTHISSVSNISSVNIIANCGDYSEVYHPSFNLDPNKVEKIERYLDAIRSNLLFAKNVILVEGDAENILIPEMIKQGFGIELDELGISLINIGSTGFRNISDLFHEDRIKKQCAIITDEDKSIVDLTTEYGTSDEDKKELVYQAKCQGSHEKGEQRKTALLGYTENNIYCKPFFAEHTFEIDWFLAGEKNQSTVIGILPEIYKKEEKIDDVTVLLENGDKSISGREALRIAEKVQKGWYSILLSGKIDHEVIIPGYIIDALAFAGIHLKNNTKALCKIMEYRVSMGLVIITDDISSLQDKEKLMYYRDKFEEDTFTIFLNKLDEYS